MFQTQLEICNCQQQSEVFFRFGVLSVFFFFKSCVINLVNHLHGKKEETKRRGNWLICLSSFLSGWPSPWLWSEGRTWCRSRTSAWPAPAGRRIRGLAGRCRWRSLPAASPSPPAASAQTWWLRNITRVTPQKAHLKRFSATFLRLQLHLTKHIWVFRRLSLWAAAACVKTGLGKQGKRLFSGNLGKTAEEL